MDENELQKEFIDKGLTAPRITPADIDRAIVAEAYYVFPGTTLTVVCLTLLNGFTVVGESACASPENFNAEIGRRIARENAVAKVWPLMGYELRSKLAAEKSLAPGLRPIDTAPTDGTVFLGYRERDGRWGECYRIQRDDCEMWG